jgi:hypothetical protein
MMGFPIHTTFNFIDKLIDLILLVKYKHHMNRKLKHINDVAQRKVIHKSKKNINRMILVNSLIYIVSHLPEFVMTILLFVYSTKLKNFCNNKFSCGSLNEEAEFFGLISIVCQFYVFKIYDKNFKNSFSQISYNFVKIFSTKKKVEIINDQTFDAELINLKNLIGNGRMD